jgi:hypothetical protein
VRPGQRRRIRVLGRRVDEASVLKCGRSWPPNVALVAFTDARKFFAPVPRKLSTIIHTRAHCAPPVALPLANFGAWLIIPARGVDAMGQIVVTLDGRKIFDWEGGKAEAASITRRVDELTRRFGYTSRQYADSAVQHFMQGGGRLIGADDDQRQAHMMATCGRSSPPRRRTPRNQVASQTISTAPISWSTSTISMKRTASSRWTSRRRGRCIERRHGQ